jgi:hypothetical protein
MFRKMFLSLALALVLVPATVFAGVFDILIASEGQTFTDSFTSIEDVIDNLDTAEIEQNLSLYTDTSAADATINFRGVPIYLTIGANSNTIVLSIPSIGVTEQFDGQDRDDSVDLIEDWLQKNGESAVTKLMQELVAETPTDPVAGNPSSLQSRMVAMDYNYATNTSEVVEMNATTQGMGINANMISIFARYTNYDLDGVSSSSFSIPLAYTFRFDNSKNSLAIRIPLSVVDVDGSKAANAGLGLGLSYFINNDWNLTTAIGYTAVASIDMASVAQLVSGSVTSAYNFKLGDKTLTLGNMIGHYKTIPFSYDEYDIDPDIKNTVLRNGLNMNIPSDSVAKGTSFEVFFIDTRYFGSELYIDQYNEIGFSYGFSKMKQKGEGDKKYNVMKGMRVGFTYLLADKADGFSVNLGFTF